MGGVNRVLLVGTISKYGIDMALQPQSASCHAGHDSVCGWRADREIHPPHRRYIGFFGEYVKFWAVAQ